MLKNIVKKNKDYAVILELMKPLHICLCPITELPRKFVMDLYFREFVILW
jgi:hypothetical protein